MDPCYMATYTIKGLGTGLLNLILSVIMNYYWQHYNVEHLNATALKIIAQYRSNHCTLLDS